MSNIRALALLFALLALPVHAEESTEATATTEATEATETTETTEATTTETTELAAFTEEQVEEEVTPVLIQQEEGEPQMAPGDDVAGEGDTPPIVDAARKVLPFTPGANPAGPLNPTGVNAGMPANVLERVATPAAARIKDALSGRAPAGPAGSMGSITRPTGVFSSTPNVSLNVNGQSINIPPPSMNRGQTMTFYRVPQPGGGVAVEARSSSGTWRLQYGTNSIIPALGSGWTWEKK